MMKKNQYSECFYNRNSIGHSKNKKNNYAGNSSLNTQYATNLLVLHLIRWFVALLIIECHQRFCHHLLHSELQPADRVSLCVGVVTFIPSGSGGWKVLTLLDQTNSELHCRRIIRTKSDWRHTAQRHRLQVKWGLRGRNRDGWCVRYNAIWTEFILPVDFFSTSSAGFLLALKQNTDRGQPRDSHCLWHVTIVVWLLPSKPSDLTRIIKRTGRGQKNAQRERNRTASNKTHKTAAPLADQSLRPSIQ